jgi:hypothetical protein
MLRLHSFRHGQRNLASSGSINHATNCRAAAPVAETKNNLTAIRRRSPATAGRQRMTELAQIVLATGRKCGSGLSVANIYAFGCRDTKILPTFRSAWPSYCRLKY